MGSHAWRVLGVAIGVVVAAGVIAFYIAGWATKGPTVFTPVAQAQGTSRSVNLTVQTVAAVGPTLSSNPDWVSYLVRNNGGQWQRSTVWRLPANALVHVTLYNFDGASGLRNPFLGAPQGLVGSERVDGTVIKAMSPDQPSHTFAVPELGVLVPIAPVPDSAKNPCDFAPCALTNDHRTITFTFRTGKPGHYRWQCFVPCAAGFLYGFGGPMQTLGYMDGFLDVS
jgi:hypothetical protein